MSAKVSRIRYSHLRREEQHSFNDRVLQILLNSCGQCGKTYERFEAAAIAFDKLIADQAMHPSLSLAELDATADNAWTAMNLQIKASLMHPRKAVRDAAIHVNEIFSKTPNPTSLNYDQEYGALRTLLTQMATLPDETVKAALVDEHLRALSDAVEVFTAASAEKVDALSKKQTGALKEAAEDCYKAWQDLTKYLELMVSLDELPGAENAINQLNVLLAGIKRRMDNRRSISEKAENIVAEEIAAEAQPQ